MAGGEHQAEQRIERNRSSERERESKAKARSGFREETPLHAASRGSRRSTGEQKLTSSARWAAAFVSGSKGEVKIWTHMGVRAFFAPQSTV